MSTAVCPYCGGDMKLSKSEFNAYWFECMQCAAKSPLETSEERAVRKAGHLAVDGEINSLKEENRRLQTQIFNQEMLKTEIARLKVENNTIRSVTDSTVHTLGVLLRGCDRCGGEDDD